jgi:uncharacterized protein (DUF2345 family)
MPFEPHDPNSIASNHPTKATLVALVDGVPRLRLAARPDRLVVARTTVPLAADAIGSEVVVQWLDGDLDQPVILGVLQAAAPGPATVEVEADDAAVQVQAKQRVTLRCGKASITLTAEGRIVVKGTQILSQATGSHRIRGGSIQLN